MLHWRHWNFYSEKTGDWAWVFGMSRYVRMEMFSRGWSRWHYRKWARLQYDACIAALQNLCIPELLSANPWLVESEK